MTGIPLRIYINEKPLTIPAGSTVAMALEAFDPVIAARVNGGAAAVTDGRGLPLTLDTPLSGGAIVRVVGGSAHQGGPDAPA
ncbi:MAG: hypothetical protein ABJC74_06860 [Gemmatimonadota bacterium]